ncbi:MAG: CBS domain-containing protein/gamma-glutamylcysteine synthetase [Bacteroidia bacterium]|jgi:CBS domain-containing protein/gamma-glutamylcysteine synthetase
MGDQGVRSISDLRERANFLRHILHDIEALDKMIEGRMFESGIQRIGAEQEFCMTNRNWEPADASAEMLEALNDEHFTTELAKYNLELNLDPVELKHKAFDKVEKQIRKLMGRAESEAEKRQLHIILTGILPTITPRHIEAEHMTPNPRFEELNKVMREHKGGDFELNIQGVDQLIAKHDSIVFEACNTSFQTHLQIEQDEAVAQYNWAQAIAAPVLALSANSPLLLGKELWAETRIALFQQSIDIRSGSTLIREQQPRVMFGTRWVRNSISEVFKEDIAKFTFLVAADVEHDSLELLKQGKIPELTALKMHNGTIYRWNRPCYGVAKGVAHLRIENRYIPAGPTVLDEMANFAFWVGLMKGMPAEYERIWEKMDFKRAKANFFRAAISGMETKLQWMGKVVDTKELIHDELLPIAENGLRKAGIDDDSIRKYLGVIRQRLSSRNGSQWMKSAYRDLKDGHLKDVSLRRMTALMHRNQSTGKPVGEWPLASKDQLTGNELKLEYVYQLMSTDPQTAHEHDLVELVEKIMEWRKFHQVPVENEAGECIGIITSTSLRVAREKHGELGNMFASEIMERNVITVDPNEKILAAKRLMIEKGIGSLPVIHDGKLVGVITKFDVEELEDE